MTDTKLFQFNNNKKTKKGKKKCQKKCQKN